MPASSVRRSGRHFLQVPGPTNIPDRILRAIDRPTIDHRGPEFACLAREVLDGLRRILRAKGPVALFPSSGTGAWEAALVNTLSPGDRVLMFETGHFALLWHAMAKKLGLEVEFLPGDWRRAVDPAAVESALADDRARRIKAVCVVHNETSTGVMSSIPAVRRAIDRADHPALLMVDTISSAASVDYRHDAWGVDVTVGSVQKGFMMPPGLGINVIGDKALAAARSSRLSKSYWSWEANLKANETGYFPYTPATNLLFGLAESIRMLEEEGLESVFQRHARLAEATRRAVAAWGLDLVAADPAAYSNSVSAVFTPPGHDADRLRQVILERFDMSLGAGLGKLQGKVFRIGHLGDLNDLTLAGVLAGVEMGMTIAGVPHRKGGVGAALDYLAGTASRESAEPDRRAAAAGALSPIS